jgi:hypothetical protein
LLRPSILLAGAVTLASWLLMTAAPAAAGGLAPDPPPAADVRPDAYPVPRSEVVVTHAPAPARVTVAPPSPPPVHRRRAAQQHRTVVRAHAHEVRRPQRPLPFATLAIKWLSDAGAPPDGSAPDVPARVALVLAALVLASAVLVAAAAREAAR